MTKTPAIAAARRSERRSSPYSERRGGASLALLIWLTVAVASPAASAIGFGHLLHQSALGRPLDVEFPLESRQALDSGLPVVSIADNDTYNATGFARAEVLNSATISLQNTGNGVLVRIRTRDRVMEPYLPLIVQVQLPSGVLRHQYDLVLDPDSAAPESVAGTASDFSVEATQPAAGQAAPGARRHGPSIAPSKPPVERPAVTAPPGHPPSPAVFSVPSAVQLQMAVALAEVPVVKQPAAVPPAAVAIPPVADSPAKAKPATRRTFQPRGWWSIPLLVVAAILALIWLVMGLRGRGTRLAQDELLSTGRALDDAGVEPAAAMPVPLERPVLIPRSIKQDTGVEPEIPPHRRQTGIEVGDASNFHDDVAALLEQALEHEPQRLDLLHKLVEVYIDGGRPEKLGAVGRRLAAPNKAWSPSCIAEVQSLIDKINEVTGLALSAPAEPALAVAPVAPRRARYYEGEEFKSLDAQLARTRNEYDAFKLDALAQRRLTELLNAELGRPSVLQPALHVRNQGGAQIFFKRDDLRLPDSEQIINLIGQMHFARTMGRREVVTSVGTVRGANAMLAAAKATKLPVTAYLQPELMTRLGDAYFTAARREHVAFLPGGNWEDPRRDALRAWLEQPDRIGYVTGLRAGPDPYPGMVMDFTSIVGRETRQQLHEQGHVEPAAIVTSARGGFSAIGFARPFLDRKAVRIVLTDPPAGLVNPLATTNTGGTQLALREHRWLLATGRVEYLEVSPSLASAAQEKCRRVEQFMPLLEDATAVGVGLELARELKSNAAVVILLSAARAV